MNANELYALKPIREDYDFSVAVTAAENITMQSGDNYPLKHIFDDDRMDYKDVKKVDEEKRVKLSYYMEEGDDKFGAILYAIRFDDKPFMIVQRCGRWYDDINVYLTDEKVLKEFENYIVEKFPLLPKDETLDVLDPTKDLPELTKFNDYDMEYYYNPNLKPIYKVGDVVWAWTPENHLKYDISNDYKGYVLTKVEIQNVKETHPYETYHGTQIERNFSGKDYEMVLTGKGGIGATINDSVIVGKVDEIPMPKLAINNLVDKDGRLPNSYVVKKPIRN